MKNGCKFSSCTVHLQLVLSLKVTSCRCFYVLAVMVTWVHRHGYVIVAMVTCVVMTTVQPRLQTCVCSIAEDYSVAILSTSERKCLLVAACHSSPVNSVRYVMVWAVYIVRGVINVDHIDGVLRRTFC